MLLVGALWGARLGRNRHLRGDNRGRINYFYPVKTALTHTQNKMSAYKCCKIDLLLQSGSIAEINYYKEESEVTKNSVLIQRWRQELCIMEISTGLCARIYYT